MNESTVLIVYQINLQIIVLDSCNTLKKSKYDLHNLLMKVLS